MSHFELQRFYDPRDPEMRLLGSVQKLTRWRHERKGPAYHLIGRSVRYLGEDLNYWLTQQRVEP